MVVNHASGYVIGRLIMSCSKDTHKCWERLRNTPGEKQKKAVKCTRCTFQARLSLWAGREASLLHCSPMQPRLRISADCHTSFLPFGA